MRATPFWLLAAGCGPGVGVLGPKLVDTTPTSDADADTDADADADTDADTDADSDTDTDTEPGHTGGTTPVEPVADHLVDCQGGGDFLTVQAAIDAAVSGQSIGLQPCEYHERIQLRGKALRLFGTAAAADTILDGDGDGTVIDVEDGESDGTRLENFTVRDGDDNAGASGLEVYRATVEVTGVVFTGNDRSHAVIQSFGGFLRLDGVVVTGNEVAGDGYAIESDEGGGITARGLRVDCDGGEVALWHHNTLVLSDSTVTCTSGVGVVDYHGEDQISRSVITGRVGIRAYDVENTPDLPVPDLPNELFVLSNSVVIGTDVGVELSYMFGTVRNSVLSGGSAALSLTGMREDTTASAVGFVSSGCGVVADAPYAIDDGGFWDNGRDGCGVAVDRASNDDPQFVAWPTDVHLAAGSPWIDAGPNAAERRDLDGSRNDVGAFGGPLGFW
jgi:hypothetical protein